MEEIHITDWTGENTTLNPETWAPDFSFREYSRWAEAEITYAKHFPVEFLPVPMTFRWTRR
jgi:hypothetical protein